MGRIDLPGCRRTRRSPKIRVGRLQQSVECCEGLPAPCCESRLIGVTETTETTVTVAGIVYVYVYMCMWVYMPIFRLLCICLFFCSNCSNCSKRYKINGLERTQKNRNSSTSVTVTDRKKEDPPKRVFLLNHFCNCVFQGRVNELQILQFFHRP